MFKTIPVAKTVARIDAPTAGSWSGFRHDIITLGWEERLRARARRTSDSGFEFATTLPRGTILRQDDCFVFEAPNLLVRVVESDESMLVIRPRTPREWATF